MSKQKQLSKKIVRTAVIAAIAIAGAVGLYMGVSLATESVDKQKQDMESKLRSDEDKLRGLKDRYDKSGVAEKSFIEIQSKRVAGTPYTSSVEQLVEYLRAAKTRYKFFKFDTTRPPKETPTDRPELANFNNQIIATRPLKFNITAISDVHIFSFLEELRSAMPGFIRVDSITLKRSADMTDGTYSALTNNGSAVALVEAKIELTWITVSAKDATNSAAPAPQDGGANP